MVPFMADPARTAALQALLKVDENAGYSNLVLDRALAAGKLAGRDGALASALFYGVLEKRLTLDYYIAQCLREPGRKPDPAAREALRCGAYQVLYMDRVPDSAAVNETVECLKAIGKGRLCGFVNGVLRGLLRKRAGLTLPQGDSPRAWAVRYSVPEPLVRLWMAAYGRGLTEKMLQGFEGRAGVFIRANTVRTTPEALRAELEGEGFRCEAPPGPAGALQLEGGGSPAGLRAFKEGRFHVQDLSAQWVCRLVDPRPGQSVCDCCAAPGGKSFTLAQLMGDRGRVLALDLYEGRVGLIGKGAERLGLRCVEPAVHDAREGFAGFGAFDRVLCDVPCSGFGVMRRKPEVRYKPLESVKGLPDVQLAILENAAGAVAPGGRLVYSTCTLNPEENGRVAERFLAGHPEFAPGDAGLPGVGRPVDEPGHCITLLPFSGGSDGFFAAVFERRA